MRGVKMEKPYLGMLGYTAKGRPFMAMDVDVDEAKDVGEANDLSEYILIPRGDKRRKHAGYIRDSKGKYEKKKTRLAVFRHLLTAGKGEVPSREDVGLA
jgi:hypothetical protein